jgi:hypothetical protein
MLKVQRRAKGQVACKLLAGVKGKSIALNAALKGVRKALRRVAKALMIQRIPCSL